MESTDQPRRAFASIGTMAGGFYTVYALRAWEAPAWWVATFTSVLLAGQIAGNLVFGFLADRAGHRLVLIAGTLIGVAGNVLALVAPSVGVFSAVFALSGVQMAAVSVSGLNVMLEFAPGAEERPTYIGLGTTLMAPVFFAAPLVAGVMADGLGFPWVFAVATAGGLISLGLFIARVHDPRKRQES